MIAPQALQNHAPAGFSWALADSASPELRHLRLRLLQPEPHVHLAAHRSRGSHVLVRLVALARAPVELAEAE